MDRPLAVVVPTRGRPQTVQDLVAAFMANGCGKADLWFAVDLDDPTAAEYVEWFSGQPNPHVQVLVQEGPGSMVAALNTAVRPLARRYPYVGFMGDDHRPRTPGWDEEVADTLEAMGTGIVTGPDGARTDQLPTWCAMTSDIVRALGYMAPPDLHHMYVDNSWQTLGMALGAFQYLPDVLVEHMHPVVHKAEMDAGYQRVNHPAVYQRDAAMYARWVDDSLPAAVAKIRSGR